MNQSVINNAIWVLFGDSLLGRVRISNFCFSDPMSTDGLTPAKAEHGS